MEVEMTLKVWYGGQLTPPLDDRHFISSYAAIEFGRVRILRISRQLLVDGELVAVGARAFELLLALIEARGRLLSKDELLSRVWPNVVVEENNLQVQICALRKALGGEGKLIKTESGRGYRFVGDAHFILRDCSGLSDVAALPLESLASWRAPPDKERAESAPCTVEQVLKLVVPTILAVLSKLGAEHVREEALAPPIRQ
jgi:DNA-binding winged helix-turn-helix (wHTH) protein